LGAWHRSAPKALRKSYRAADNPAGWAAWRKHLARRKRRTPAELLAARRPLRWALPGGNLDAALNLMSALERAGKRSRRELPTIEHMAAVWLSGAPSAPPVASFALECLAWAHALPQLTTQLSPHVWWQLAEQLVAIASRPSDQAGPLSAQLLWAELPLTLAYNFPEIDACQALAEPGLDTLATGFAELLDGEGLIHAQHLHLQWPLIACWTRSQSVAKRLPEGGWPKPLQTEFALLLRNAARLTRPDGRPALATTGPGRAKPALLAAATRLADDRLTLRFLAANAGEVPTAALDNQHPLWPSRDGEWAALAAMRSNWLPSSPKLIVAYPDRILQSELTIGRRTLWSGTWSCDVRVNGQPLEAVENWSQVCWESNEDVDYLELELPLSSDVTLQRSILLARQEQFLLLADAVVGLMPLDIEYRSTLPLGVHSTFVGESETSEGVLTIDSRPLARVLPLALAEWRAAHSPGSLQANEAGLQLTQSAAGQALFCPLLIDLSANRLAKEVTWRQLTVAAARTIVPAEDAVGYRVQVGKRQWLIYRSLTDPSIRSVLGQNVSHDLYVARFHGEARVDALLEIE